MGPEQIVALALPRSADMIVAILGVLKAGAGYLPLDLNYPGARITFMLDDARPVLLLTSTLLDGELPDSDPIPRLVTDHPDTVKVLGECPDSDPTDTDRTVCLRPQHPAYVIYTSGSTGQPKGVVACHHGIANLFSSRHESVFAPMMVNVGGRRLRVAHTSPFSFDASWDQLVWMLAGHEVHVVDEVTLTDPNRLVAYVDAQRIDYVDVTPSYAQLLISHGLLDDGRWRPTVVVLGGEAVSDQLWDRLRSVHGVKGINAYGPTEYTVTALTAWVNHSLRPVLGRPIANTQVYVLDAALQLVAPGVAGELYLAGAGLARGYLRRPGLTAERFVADPFGIPAGRMYRTGDLVRWRLDGDLEFVGRTDDQVKIRGFRIEPGEIETILEAHHDVAQAAAIVREDRPGDRRLVAYVVAAGNSLQSGSLQEFLRQRLPNYMVPAAFVVVDALPLTPNGKLDRDALPVPELSSANTGRAPRTPQEQLLCELFAEVLGVPHVGVDDNFFDLGGHSLLATRLVARVRATLGVELELRALFETPTVAGIAARLADAGPAKLTLTRHERPDVVPLSFAQRRLWFLHQMEGTSATYNMPLALRLSGKLDRPALQAALGDVVTRHETLRTVFTQVEGVPCQSVLDVQSACPALRVTETTEADLPGRLAAAARYGFDLGAEPPVRAELFALAPDEHVLLVLMHHIAGDGASMGPLSRDLAVAYTTRCRGAAPGWAPLPVQYVDYTLWQHQLLGDEADPDSLFAAEVAYWTRALAELPEQLALPTDRPRPVVASYYGGLVEMRLDAQLHRGLVSLARRVGASVFMALQAGLAALLSRLGAGVDIPIGSPIAGRTDQALDDLVGFFVNTLVLRTDTSGNPTFQQLVARARETALAAYAHQDVPFEYLVEVVNPVRSLARHPLFQVMLVVQNATEDGFNLPGLDASSVPVDTDVAKFDLTFALSERRGVGGAPEGIDGVVGYARDLFDPATVEAIVARWVRLLEAAVAEPDRPISRIDILSTDERARLLVEYPDTTAEVSQASLPVLVETQVKATPDTAAVISGDTTLSYAQLNAQANRLAHALIAHGVGPEHIVALALPRSPQLVVALVAVLKAGAGYQPLDPDYPAARIAFMLEDARPALLLTSRLLEGGLPRRGPIPRLVIDHPDTVGLLAGYPDTDPTDTDRTTCLRPQHPAYVIYTSGSTGAPKGVMMPVAGLMNLLRWHHGALGGDPGTRIAQFTALSFDVSAQEILSTLAFGKTLVIPPDEVRRDAQQLVDWLDQYQVQELFAPNLVIEALAEAAIEHGRDLARLRRIAQGGEALTLSHRVHEFYHRQPGRRLHNHYGPTETHAATAYTLPADVDDWPLPAPIGRPITNIRAYVLDAGLLLVPAGVIGELYLAGVGLARGYLHRAALTAQRFVADPYGPPGERMYRTGDLVRWRADGNLEFVGRIDDQVKIRGFRVELGEIETALTAHPQVAQSAVVTHQDRPGDTRLVGYVVADGDGCRTGVLREFLGERLPDYMVPAAVMVLDALPLTPHGKLDRRALPVPEFDRAGTGRAPRTPQEQLLCDLFAEVLGLAGVGIDDDFFDLGGHSLLATRLIARIRASFDVELQLRALFETPTPAQLAARLDDAAPARLALTSSERPDVVPLSFAQRRLWFLHQMEGPSATYNMPLALRLSGELDQQALQDALGDVVARHEILRTVFPHLDGVPSQQVQDARTARPQLTIIYPNHTELPALLTAAAHNGFDLATEIPVRAELFVLAPDEHVLLVLVHHIAADGWSLGPLSADLAAAYAARCRGEEPGWAPLPVQYADYTLWQHRLLGDQADPDSLFATQLAYWTDTLSGLPEQLQLPTDRPRPARASYRGGLVTVALDAGLHQGLRELARRGGASVFMVLQAGLAALLHRLGAGDDVAVGSPIAGRTDQALDDLVGFFVNTLVLRTDVSGNPSFAELLARVRETALAAYAHQDVPFEYLVEVLNPARSLARHPLFQIMLALQNAPDINFALPGLDTSFVPAPTATARMDLSISLAERRGLDGNPEGIHGVVEYASDLFDPATIETMLVRWTRLLHAAVADPDRSISRIEIVSAQERQRVLVDYNNVAAPVPAGSLAGLFEAQVRATPEAVAVVCGDVELSYAQLNARANQLARRLVAGGVGRESAVGVLLERSVDLVVTILAVVKAGGVYVPLDARYPLARMTLVLAETTAAVLVTDRVMRAGRVPDCGQVIVVDASPTVTARDPGDLGIRCDPGQLAYVMYTSGSTGAPKGIGVTHRDVVELAADPCWHGGAHQRVLLHSPHAFDASTYEVWVPLLSGGQIVVAPPGELDIPTLEQTIVGHQVTGLWLTADLFGVLAEQCPDCFTGVRQVWTGGDVVSGVAVARVLDACLATTVINGYGPTETTTFAAHHVMRAPYDPTPTVPIGRPMANTRLYVLDARLEPSPVGVAGELYIAGAGLARGYLHQPTLTAPRFVADPHGPAGTRMYRTGDLACWNTEGNLEFLGRADDQVKIRGFRIEPAEIQTVLTTHPTSRRQQSSFGRTDPEKSG
ncbi:MAG: amino acid adenylation domain-containing protein [Pseudonocardiaceae bacterium]